MKIYCVQVQHTAGAYKTMTSFKTKESAESFMKKQCDSDPLYNTGNKHNCNRYRIISEDIDD